MEKKSNSNPTMLMSLYDEDLERLAHRIRKDRSVNTFNTLKQGRNYVAAYLAEQFGCTDIPVDDLTPQTIYDFSAYLSAERRLRGGTVWLICQQLKGVIKRAHQRGILTWNPFAGFHIPKNIRPREYLTEEELNRLISHDFKRRELCLAKDIFLFSAFTGLSYIDIRELSSSDIVKLENSTWIVSKRHKTKIPYQVKLLEYPLSILHHYQRYGQEKIFGRIEYRTLAYHIKKIMDEMGFNKSITMHCARHSFAVLAINKGMPIESLSRILGHSNITTTQIYAKITMQKLETDITEFERHLNIII